uniref:Uncharacterized protein n=1 Tax=Laticauda laticaudata TaxID=8630 RepID=A0A8C5RFC6_LATLA
MTVLPHLSNTSLVLHYLYAEEYQPPIWKSYCERKLIWKYITYGKKHKKEEISNDLKM